MEDGKFLSRFSRSLMPDHLKPDFPGSEPSICHRNDVRMDRRRTAQNVLCQPLPACQNPGIPLEIGLTPEFRSWMIVFGAVPSRAGFCVVLQCRSRTGFLLTDHGK